MEVKNLVISIIALLITAMFFPIALNLFSQESIECSNLEESLIATHTIQNSYISNEEQTFQKIENSTVNEISINAIINKSNTIDTYSSDSQKTNTIVFIAYQFENINSLYLKNIVFSIDKKFLDGYMSFYILNATYNSSDIIPHVQISNEYYFDVAESKNYTIEINYALHTNTYNNTLFVGIQDLSTITGIFKAPQDIVNSFTYISNSYILQSFDLLMNISYSYQLFLNYSIIQQNTSNFTIDFNNSNFYLNITYTEFINYTKSCNQIQFNVKFDYDDFEHILNLTFNSILKISTIEINNENQKLTDILSPVLLNLDTNENYTIRFELLNNSLNSVIEIYKMTPIFIALAIAVIFIYKIKQDE